MVWFWLNNVDIDMDIDKLDRLIYWYRWIDLMAFESNLVFRFRPPKIPEVPI